LPDIQEQPVTLPRLCSEIGETNPRLNSKKARRTFRAISRICGLSARIQTGRQIGHAWLIDAVPDPVLGETLRTYAENMTASPVPGGNETGLRMRGCPSCMTMAVIGRHLRVKQQVSSPQPSHNTVLKKHQVKFAVSAVR